MSSPYVTLFSTVQNSRSKRDPADLGQMDSFVPGVTPVWVKTWGCSHNASDSEYMAGILAKVRRSYRYLLSLRLRFL